jgi:hypothetical protein
MKCGEETSSWHERDGIIYCRDCWNVRDCEDFLERGIQMKFNNHGAKKFADGVRIDTVSGETSPEYGVTTERNMAVDIMEYLGVETEGDEWYEQEDRVTDMISEVVMDYLNHEFYVPKNIK